MKEACFFFFFLLATFPVCAAVRHTEQEDEQQKRGGNKSQNSKQSMTYFLKAFRLFFIAFYNVEENALLLKLFDGFIYKVEKYFHRNWVTLNRSNCIFISVRGCY